MRKLKSQLKAPKTSLCPQALADAKWRSGLKNRLSELWNQPAFAQEIFRIHNLGVPSRSVHSLGSGLVWGRGFFGEHLIAELSQNEQLCSILPFDRKEAALFGLAAEALGSSRAPQMLAIGAASSHRSQGFAQLCRIFNATLRVFEPSADLCAKFFCELKLNGGVAPGHLMLFQKGLFPAPEKRADRPKNSALHRYLKSLGEALDQLPFGKGPLQSKRSDARAIGQADVVWIESKLDSAQITCQLLPHLPPSTPIVLRIAPLLLQKEAFKRWSLQCIKHKRSPYSLSDGMRRSWQEIKVFQGTLWLAMI